MKNTNVTQAIKNGCSVYCYINHELDGKYVIAASVSSDDDFNIYDVASFDNVTDAQDAFLDFKASTPGARFRDGIFKKLALLPA